MIDILDSNNYFLLNKEDQKIFIKSLKIKDAINITEVAISDIARYKRMGIETEGKYKLFFSILQSFLKEMLNKIQFKEISIDYGFVPHENISLKELKEIRKKVDKYHDKDKVINYLELFYINKFNINAVEEILNIWKMNSKITHRIPIIEQAITSHINGLYYASISTLIPQIEGLIIEKNINEQEFNKRNIKDYVSNILPKRHETSYDEAIYLFYDNVVLANFDFKEEIKSKLSRHAIAHGADTKYGSEVNSIALILLLDNIIGRL